MRLATPFRRDTRAAKAARTRARMIAAARDLFIQRGYAATSMQAIAAQAGVAVQTLYFTFETKRALLKELVDVEVAGDTAPVPTLDRHWVAQAMAAPPAEMLRSLVAAAADIHARVTPVIEVVRSAAAADPEIADLWRTNIEQRHTVLMAFTRTLASRSELRPGLDATQAADIALAILAPEVYHLLTHERGWNGAAWTEWAVGALTSSLLATPA